MTAWLPTPATYTPRHRDSDLPLPRRQDTRDTRVHRMAHLPRHAFHDGEDGVTSLLPLRTARVMVSAALVRADPTSARS